MAVFWYLLMLLGWGLVCLAVDGMVLDGPGPLDFIVVVGAALFVLGTVGMRGNETRGKAKIVGGMLLLTGSVCGCWCLGETLPTYVGGPNADPHFGLVFMIATYIGLGGYLVLRREG